MRNLFIICCAVFSACTTYTNYDFSSLRPERYDLKMFITANGRNVFTKEITTDSLFMFEDSLKIAFDTLCGVIPIVINVEGSWQSARPIYRIIYGFDNWEGEILFNNRETGASVMKDKIYIGDSNKAINNSIKTDDKDIILSPKNKYAVKIGIGM